MLPRVQRPLIASEKLPRKHFLVSVRSPSQCSGRNIE